MKRPPEHETAEANWDWEDQGRDEVHWVHKVSLSSEEEPEPFVEEKECGKSPQGLREDRKGVVERGVVEERESPEAGDLEKAEEESEKIGEEKSPEAGDLEKAKEKSEKIGEEKSEKTCGEEIAEFVGEAEQKVDEAEIFGEIDAYEKV